MKRILIKSRPAHLAVFSLVLVSLTSFTTAIKKVKVSVTPRDHTKVNGYVCGIDTAIDPDRMVAEKNSAFIFDLLGRTRNKPEMGPEYQALLFDVAFYEDDPKKNVRFSLPNIGRYDVVVLFLLPSNAQCNQLTFKNAADQSDLYFPVYIGHGSSATQKEVISEYLKLEPGIKNHFGTKMPKLCGVKMFMGHPLVAVSRSEAISFLFNFAFNTKRQLRIDTKTSCTKKDDTEGSLQMSKKIDTTASFSFKLSKKKVDDRNVFLKSDVRKEKSGKISVIYVEPVFEAEPGQKSATDSDIVDHRWPVVFNKASTTASFFLLIKDDDDINQFMKLRFRHVNWVQSLHGDNNQVVEINSDAKLNFKPEHGKLKVYTIPVGQGDSTLIQCPNGAISFIDMGCLGGCTMYGWEGYSKQMNTFFPTGDYSQLKHVFFTHPDADHINYALETKTNGKPSGGFLHKILNSNVNAEIHFGEKAGWDEKKKWFTEFFSKNQQSYKVVFHEKHGTKPPFTWQDINICGTNDWFIKIIASDLGKVVPNDRSMVMSLQLKSNHKVQKKMLFMGDFQGDPQYELLNDYVKLYQGHEVLMVPHHGADTGGNAETTFFNLVFDGHDERHIIVSSALWSTHKHPKGYLLMSACEKPQDDFLDQRDNGANANKNTIMGWFPRFKQVLLQAKDTKYVYSKYADTIAFSYDCNGHGLYQTTKVDFKTNKRMAFTYQTTFTDDPNQTAVNSQKAKMNTALEEDRGSLEWSYTGKILHL